MLTTFAITALALAFYNMPTTTASNVRWGATIVTGITIGMLVAGGSL